MLIFQGLPLVFFFYKVETPAAKYGCFFNPSIEPRMFQAVRKITGGTCSLRSSPPKRGDRFSVLIGRGGQCRPPSTKRPPCRLELQFLLHLVKMHLHLIVKRFSKLNRIRPNCVLAIIPPKTFVNTFAADGTLSEWRIHVIAKRAREPRLGRCRLFFHPRTNGRVA